MQYTALCSGGVGAVVKGSPEDVQKLLDAARPLRDRSVGLFLDGGMVFVDPRRDWRLEEVERA